MPAEPARTPPDGEGGAASPEREAPSLRTTSGQDATGPLQSPYMQPRKGTSSTGCSGVTTTCDRSRRRRLEIKRRPSFPETSPWYLSGAICPNSAARSKRGRQVRRPRNGILVRKPTIAHSLLPSVPLHACLPRGIVCGIPSFLIPLIRATNLLGTLAAGSSWGRWLLCQGPRYSGSQNGKRASKHAGI